MKIPSSWICAAKRYCLFWHLCKRGRTSKEWWWLSAAACCRSSSLVLQVSRATCHVRDFTCQNSGAYLRFLYFYFACMGALAACMLVHKNGIVGSWLLLFVCPDLSGTASVPPCAQWFPLLSADFSPSWDCSGLAHLSSLARNSYLWQVDKWICCLPSHVNLFFIERWESGRVICPKNTTAVILLGHLQISTFFLHLGVPPWWACYGSEGTRCFLCLSTQF